MKIANPVNFFSGIFNFLKEVKMEAKKVNWPTRQRTINDTLIVIVFSVVVAAFLSVFDNIFQALLKKFL